MGHVKTDSSSQIWLMDHCLPNNMSRKSPSHHHSKLIYIRNKNEDLLNVMEKLHFNKVFYIKTPFLEICIPYK